MWELSQSHCCATCRFSCQLNCCLEASCEKSDVDSAGNTDLFPLSQMLRCEFCRGSLGEMSVQAVLVRPDGRCEAYECDSARYKAIHGSEPLEDEELYSFHVLESARAVYRPDSACF